MDLRTTLRKLLVVIKIKKKKFFFKKMSEGLTLLNMQLKNSEKYCNFNSDVFQILIV